MLDREPDGKGRTLPELARAARSPRDLLLLCGQLRHRLSAKRHEVGVVQLRVPHETAPFSDLKGRAMVAWPATCDQPRIERVLRESDALPRVVFRSASNEALSMVRFGLGCAILPRLAVAGAVGDRGLRIHALDPSPSREIHLHWPARRALSPLATRAIELAQQIADDLTRS